MPKSRKEQAQAIILIAIALIIAGLFDPIREAKTMVFGKSANAHYIDYTEYRNEGPNALVGIYAFETGDGSMVTATGRIKHKTVEAIPKTAKVAWALGEPHKAIVFKQGPNNYLTAIAGFCLLFFGLWLFKSAPKTQTA
jgi:hypothetical protein